MVGPITAQPKPSPLPPDLLDFINSAGGNGFIIASFGSYVQKVISKGKIDILASAFGKLKQKVIWKLTGKPVDTVICLQTLFFIQLNPY